MLRITISTLAIIFSLTMPWSLHAQTRSFISFDVEPTSAGVMIYWKTVPGSDTLHFEVVKSTDEKTWKRIADIVPGPSHYYSFTDTEPATGLIYYSVRQVDGNGRLSYTPIKWVQYSKTGKLYIWPNPAKDILYIRTPFVSGSIDILDPAGKSRMKISIINFITSVPLTGLSKGVYFMHIKHSDKIFVEKFVKE